MDGFKGLGSILGYLEVMGVMVFSFFERWVVGESDRKVKATAYMQLTACLLGSSYLSTGDAPHSSPHMSVCVCVCVCVCVYVCVYILHKHTNTHLLGSCYLSTGDAPDAEMYSSVEYIRV